jgi:hypothetical protein
LARRSIWKVISLVGTIETIEELRQLLFDVPGDTGVEIATDIAITATIGPGALPLALTRPRRPGHQPRL